MFEFLALIRAHCRQARAVYDCSSSNSYMSLCFFQSLDLSSSSQRELLISVDTSSGLFTCPVNLFSCPGPMDFDVVLGRDWFNYCTTAIEDAHVLLTDGRRLVFNASPFHAVFAESDLTGEWLFSFHHLSITNIQTYETLSVQIEMIYLPALMSQALVPMI